MRRQTKKFTKNLKTIAAACLLSTVVTGTADAVVLTFDDLNPNVGGSASVATYQGFNLSGNPRYVGVGGVGGFGFGAHSGDFAFLNSIGTSIVADGAADFTFDGLWAKVWNTPPESGGVDSRFGTLQGYNNGTQVWSVDTSLNGSYKFYGAQAGLIDELRLGFGFNTLIDDISLNESVTGPIDPTDPLPSAVPVPAALPLFGTGLAIMGFVGWRRKRLAAV